MDAFSGRTTNAFVRLGFKISPLLSKKERLNCFQRLLRLVEHCHRVRPQCREVRKRRVSWFYNKQIPPVSCLPLTTNASLLTLLRDNLPTNCYVQWVNPLQPCFYFSSVVNSKWCGEL